MADDDRVARLMSEVEERGVAPVARDLGVPPTALTTYLVGRARLGTAMRVERGDDARRAHTTGPRAA